jgi:hypothetical protein
MRSATAGLGPAIALERGEDTGSFGHVVERVLEVVIPTGNATLGTDTGEWPGVRSNRRPADFQDYSAVSVSGRHRPSPAPERPRDGWSVPANEHE